MNKMKTMALLLLIAAASNDDNFNPEDKSLAFPVRCVQ